jgi:hypothetical protein
LPVFVNASQKPPAGIRCTGIKDGDQEVEREGNCAQARRLMADGWCS